MLNYVSAEFYKVLHRKYTWITLGILLGCEALLVYGWVFINVHGSHIDFAQGLTTVFLMLTMGCYFTLVSTDMVFADQYKQSTLKNEVSFGIPRTVIYLGKLLVMLVMSVLFMVVMLGFYTVLCYSALFHDPERDLSVLACLGECILGALPIWFGIQALCCACFFLIRSSLAASFTALGLFNILGTVLQIAALMFQGYAIGKPLMKLYQWMPLSGLDQLPEVVGNAEQYWPLLGRLCIVGAFWFVGSTALGLVGFQRKEIN